VRNERLVLWNDYYIPKLDTALRKARDKRKKREYKPYATSFDIDFFKFKRFFCDYVDNLVYYKVNDILAYYTDLRMFFFLSRLHLSFLSITKAFSITDVISPKDGVPLSHSKRLYQQF
jgi:hypothetical protein